MYNCLFVNANVTQPTGPPKEQHILDDPKPLRASWCKNAL